MTCPLKTTIRSTPRPHARAPGRRHGAGRRGDGEHPEGQLTGPDVTAERGVRPRDRDRPDHRAVRRDRHEDLTVLAAACRGGELDVGVHRGPPDHVELIATGRADQHGSR
jgi:hypothetical protein